MLQRIKLIIIFSIKKEYIILNQWSIFPGCLTATNEGYRTPNINKLVSVNSPSLGALLDIESERGIPFKEIPLRVANGARTHDPRYHKPML